MAHINISEKDFETVAGAALEAKRVGNMKDAVALDKIARKINAALTAGGEIPSIARKFGFPEGKRLTWEDMPSVIGEAPRDDATKAGGR